MNVFWSVHIIRSQTPTSAAVFLTDMKTQSTISIYNGDSGSFVAFYGPNASRSGHPQLAISADGIQVLGKDGKPVIIDTSELAKLDVK